SPLYHYTDAAGLLGILKSGTLWLSDMKSMSDKRELLHGIDIGRSILRKKSKKPNVHRATQMFSARFDEMGDMRENQHLHVVCLAKDGNDLSQWRGYADDGHGFALGFNGPALVKALAAREIEGCRSKAIRIQYEDKMLRRRCRYLVSMFVEYMDWPERLGRI